MELRTDSMIFVTGSIQALGNAEYRFIADLVYERSRICLGDEKGHLVASRVSKRLRKLGLNSYREYVDLLKSPLGQSELGNLIDVISTNHTNFFREIKHFEFLQEVGLPFVCEQMAQRGETCLRVWSAASSSGEEPYTLALVLSEFMESRPKLTWEIDATDISTRILEKAKAGVYDAERLESVPPQVLRKYFQRGTGKWEGHFRIKQPVRDRVHFHHLNLLQPQYPFDHKFHVIFCRNVMIYFDRPTQQTLVRQLSNFLHPQGYLMVGHSESLTSISHSLNSVCSATYQLI